MESVRMNIAQIEEDLQQIVKDLSPDEFIFDFLRAYGFKQSTITLIKKGSRNLSKKDGQIVLKNKLFFQHANGKDIHATIDALRKDKATFRYDPRFIIVTDYKILLAIDTKTQDSLDVDIQELPRRFNFFLPWTGNEKYKAPEERRADVQAAEKMAKLYDEILKDNPCSSPEQVHSLNVFLSRLLFCFFAEDTGIFKKGAFTALVGSYTQNEGGEVGPLLERLFKTLNTKERTTEPDYLKDFQYVNGGLFADEYKAPSFSRRSRRMLIDCGELNWKEINPDIFGSMIQAVVHADQRSGMGMHYTSVPNIMKVIHPLFLDDLNDQYKMGHNNPSKLKTLLKRIYNLKIFDPACGSGNFLIIAYKELRKLEINIFMQLQKHDPDWAGDKSSIMSGLRLSQFYGIELDDFAHEVAILSLWLAEHQMNLLFKETFGSTKPALPLHEGGNIVCGNATRIPWEDVCPKDKDAEIYILGNPPYLGARNQDIEQKRDMAHVFRNREEYKDADYVSCWFLKGAEYIARNNACFAFVSTNSICQGDHIANLWPFLFDFGIEVFFAHQSFKWTNNAKHKAAVICVIVGMRNKGVGKKNLYSDGSCRSVPNINPYLAAGADVVVKAVSSPLSHLPKMSMGSMARDGGNLILSSHEKEELIKKDVLASHLIKQLVGAQEYLNGQERWCLWISDQQLEQARQIPHISSRIDAVYKFRISSEAKTTRGYAAIPHKFAQRSHVNGNSIIVPRVSSERREYIPFGFLNHEQVISDSAQAIYGADPYVFGVISSKMHMVWVRAVAGRLKTDYRYSSALCYNTFPLPVLTEKQKESISTHAYSVLEEREKFPEKTMAQLYDPDKMPDEL